MMRSRDTQNKSIGGERKSIKLKPTAASEISGGTMNKNIKVERTSVQLVGKPTPVSDTSWGTMNKSIRDGSTSVQLVGKPTPVSETSGATMNKSIRDERTSVQLVGKPTSASKTSRGTEDKKNEDQHTFIQPSQNTKTVRAVSIDTVDEILKVDRTNFMKISFNPTTKSEDIVHQNTNGKSVKISPNPSILTCEDTLDKHINETMISTFSKSISGKDTFIKTLPKPTSRTPSGTMAKHAFTASKFYPKLTTSKTVAAKPVTSTAGSGGTMDKGGKDGRNSVEISPKSSTSVTASESKMGENMKDTTFDQELRITSLQSECDVDTDEVAELNKRVVHKRSEVLTQGCSVVLHTDVISENVNNVDKNLAKSKQNSHSTLIKVSKTAVCRLKRSSRLSLGRREDARPSTSASAIMRKRLTRACNQIVSVSQSACSRGHDQDSADEEPFVYVENAETESYVWLSEHQHDQIENSVRAQRKTRKNRSLKTGEKESRDIHQPCSSKKQCMPADILNKELRICLPRIDHVLNELVETYSKLKSQERQPIESTDDESNFVEQKDNICQNLSDNMVMSPIIHWQQDCKTEKKPLMLQSSLKQANELPSSKEPGPSSDANSPVPDCKTGFKGKMSSLFDLSVSTPEVLHLKQEPGSEEDTAATVSDWEDARNFSSLSTQEPLSLLFDFPSSGSQLEVSSGTASGKSLSALPCSIIDQCQQIYQSLGKDHVGEASAEVLACLSITKDESDAIEETTRLQVACDAWYYHRRGRLTASTFADVAYFGQIEGRKTSLLKKILQDVRYPSSTWGLDHEQKALKEYCEIIKGHHQNLRVSSCGLVINPLYPHLGATPDSWVDCDCCGRGVVEVKCPVSFPAFKSGRSNKCSFSLLSPHKKGLPVCENALAQEHGYFYQVQGQMAVCDVDFCDFICWTPSSIHVERIKRDINFFNRLKEDLDLFYLCDVIPAIVSNRWK